MIVETSANKFYKVVDLESPDMAHVWYGHRIKLVCLLAMGVLL